MTFDNPASAAEAGLPRVLGRPSSASDQEPRLETRGSAATAGYRAAGGSTEWCTFRAATVNGVRHRLGGQPGQDSYAWAVGDSRIALAVTDGLGTVDGSARAAAMSAVAAADAAIETSEDDAALTGIEAANRTPLHHGATTIIVAVVKRDRRIDVARVGDSTAFLVDPVGPTWTELFDPAEGDRETVNVTTAAIPADQPEIERAAAQLQQEEILVLVTDGIADPWRDGPTTVAPALAALASAHPSPLALASAADFSRQGCHDDRTIVLLWLGG